MEKLSSYDLLNVLYYLNAKDMKALRYTCKRFYRDECMIINIAFRHICDLRWSESETKLLKVMGAQSWEQGHDILIWKKRIPKGVYTTPKNVIVFGHGRDNGCDGWVMVAHTDNTKLHNINNPNLIPHIELRICLQNTDHNMLYFQPNNSSIDIMDESQNIISSGKNVRCHINTVQVIAKNGHKIADDMSFNATSGSYSISRPSSTSFLSSQLFDFTSDSCKSLNPIHDTLSKLDENVIALRQYEHVVITVEVQVYRFVNSLDEDPIEHETDFLTLARCLKINNLYPSSVDHCMYSTDSFSKSLECRFVNESDLWEHYIELPGNVILLRRDCNLCSVNPSLRF